MTDPMENHNDLIEVLGQQCLAFRIRMLNRLITGIYDEALKDTGLTVNQLSMLAVIGHFGPIKPAVLSSRVLMMEKSTVSRNVSLLKRNGWIVIAGDEQDERSHRLALTDEGRRVLKSAYPKWCQAQESAKALLGEDLSRALVNMMPPPSSDAFS